MVNIKTIMKRCMQIDNIKNLKIDKPLVSILLALYKPNEAWLIEQLTSLNDQTYTNIELVVYDDCPEFPTDEELFKKYITKFKYSLFRGKDNKGSNKAFEELTKIANGDFFAYCDQDDVWEKDKIELLLNLIKKENSALAYSDMSVIDKNSILVAKTLQEVRPRLKYIYGDKLYFKAFFSNCIAGCCMLVDKEMAKKSIPFSEVTVHDQWICIIASFYGKISFIDKQLVKYRIHGNNQTGILSGVYTKKDYYNIRLIPLKQRIIEIKEFISCEALNEIEKFYEARVNRDILKIFKYRYLSKKEAYFEIIIKFIPNWLFKIIINRLK